MRVLVGVPQGRQLVFPASIVDILNGRVRKDFFDQMANIPVKTPEEVKTQARLEFLTIFRQLIDQWLATGTMLSHGEEDDPWERSVWFAIPDETPISDTIWEYFRRNHPHAGIYGDSRISTSFSPHPKLSAIETARDWAIYVFMELLNSPTRECLFRCDECRKYFEFDRLPRKGTPIRHGSFCSNCKNAGAARRVEKRRSDRTAEMIRWAADAQPLWISVRQGSIEDWMVKQVNTRIGRTGNRIARNWVTRHRAEIEAEVERRKGNA